MFLILIIQLLDLFFSLSFLRNEQFFYFPPYSIIYKVFFNFATRPSAAIIYFFYFSSPHLKIFGEKKNLKLKIKVLLPKQPFDPSSVAKKHIVVPGQLERFLTVLLEGSLLEPSEKTKRHVHSLGQDILFSISKGSLQPPKHVVLANAVRSLTGNVEIITILNRLGHAISYSKLLEIETSLCMLKLSKSQSISLCLPKYILPHVNTTVAFDNIDRIEETLSGGGTSHCVNGIIVQPKVYGPFLPLEQPPLPKHPKRRSLIDFIEDVHIAAYVPGTAPRDRF